MKSEQEHQYIVDATGKRVAVILSVEEYEALLKRSEPGGEENPGLGSGHSLFGALRHLGTTDSSPEAIDEARRELWGDWGERGFE